MATETTLKVKRRKLKKKRSFKEKLFSLHDRKSAQPKLKQGSSSSPNNGSPGNHQLHNTLNVHLSQSSGSKLAIFIQETFEKLTNSPPNRCMRSVSSPNMNTEPMKLMKLSPDPSSPKSYWRPSLDIIYDDPRLLSALIAFQERSYNAESILFLQAVHHLNAQIDAFLETEHKSDETEIDQSIYDIFELYVSHSADYQINVSSECSSNANTMCQFEFVSTCSVEEKRKIFDESVSEIENLMLNSVLGLFYESREFQSIAHNCKQSPTPSPPNIKPTTAPIQLSLSQCTLSMDIPAVVSPANSSALSMSIELETPENDDAFEDDADELVFIDQEYHDFHSLNV